ncbi:MAG: GTP cyclohydrolase, FolE2/MptA family [Chloroflexota bacterium]
MTNNLDLPGLQPSVRFPLARVATSTRLVPLTIREGDAYHQHLGSIELGSDLPAKRKGLHLSRFGQILQEVSERKFESLQHLADYLAGEIIELQEVSESFAEVHVPWAIDSTTPISGMKTKKIYQIQSRAVANSTRKIELGIILPFFIACPCVQINIEEYIKSQIKPDEKKLYYENKELLSLVPLPSHTQRGFIEVWLDDNTQQLRPVELIRVIEQCITVSYDLLKRPDEVKVVLDAHNNPKFCEDVTREVAEAIYRAYYDTLSSDTNLSVKVTTEESIHSFDIVSELKMRFSEIATALDSSTVKEKVQHG